jgi:hypothetical protein
MALQGAHSDVNGLLLGRQQSVHGCWHRLHVDLRAESGLTGVEAGKDLMGSTSHHGGLPRSCPNASGDLTPGGLHEEWKSF